jgi:hypothetical protein
LSHLRELEAKAKTARRSGWESLGHEDHENHSEQKNRQLMMALKKRITEKSL